MIFTENYLTERVHIRMLHPEIRPSDVNPTVFDYIANQLDLSNLGQIVEVSNNKNWPCSVQTFQDPRPSVNRRSWMDDWHFEAFQNEGSSDDFWDESDEDESDESDIDFEDSDD